MTSFERQMLILADRLLHSGDTAKVKDGLAIVKELTSPGWHPNRLRKLVSEETMNIIYPPDGSRRFSG